METIKWENANALEIGMLMEMAEDGYVFCIEDGKIQAVYMAQEVGGFAIHLVRNPALS